MKSNWWKQFSTWVGIFFLVRLYGIWNPPLETWHSWRQTLTAMIARNMSEGNFSLLYPQIDMSGDRTGILGSEFPFFQVLIASFNSIFGYQQWYGRLISLIVASFGVYAFYLIVKRLWNEQVAKYAGILLLCSLWFAFSRKIMPDVFAVSLVLIGIWWIIRFVESNSWVFWSGALLLLTLGGLSKIPATYLFIGILPFMMNSQVTFRIRFWVMTCFGLATAIIGWWYFIWVPHLVDTYHFQLFFPKTITEGLNEIKPLWFDFWKQIYFGGMRSYVVLLFVGIGGYFLVKGKKALSLGIFLSIGVFLLFAVKTGTVFPTHNYYVLPLVPIIALIAGIGLSAIPQKWAVAAAVVICIEGLGNQISDFRIKEEVIYKLTLEAQLNAVLKPHEKVVIFAGPDPQLTYWLNRKTWSIERAEFGEKLLMERIRKDGVQFVVLDRNVDASIPGQKPVFTTKDCLVYRIQ